MISAEGPRGTLVLELSTREPEASEARVTRTAPVGGVVALALGMLLAFAIARSLGRRIASIADTASAVASGDLDQKLVEVRGHDEIATLAAAFNAMLAQIQSLFAQIKPSAEQEQARLRPAWTQPSMRRSHKRQRSPRSSIRGSCAGSSRCART